MAPSCGERFNSGSKQDPAGPGRARPDELRVADGIPGTPIFKHPSNEFTHFSCPMICKNAPEQSCRFIFDNPSITFGLFFGNASEPQDLKNGLADDGR